MEAISEQADMREVWKRLGVDAANNLLCAKEATKVAKHLALRRISFQPVESAMQGCKQ